MSEEIISGLVAKDERIKTLAHERNVKDKEVKALRNGWYLLTPIK